jgi:hypothetical protein
MKIYNYHPYYKYFTSCTDADESPLEPGIFLIPAHATTIKPPDFKESEIPVFTENDWEIVTNYAGIYYNKLTYQPFEWNDPFTSPVNGTTKIPPKVEDGFILIWEDDDWVLVENKMGIYYDKLTHQPFEWNDPFTFPMHGTKKVPPKVEDGFVLIWEDDDWVLVESKAGTYYNILTGKEIINENHFNEPENSTKEPPPQVSDGYAIMWDDGWKVIEIPPPVELTPEEKLAQAGLTIEELKKLLGLS